MFVVIDVGTCDVTLVCACSSLTVKVQVTCVFDVGWVWLILMLSHSLVILFVYLIIACFVQLHDVPVCWVVVVCCLIGMRCVHRQVVLISCCRCFLPA
jgi:hypothetical protein